MSFIESLKERKQNAKEPTKKKWSIKDSKLAISMRERRSEWRRSDHKVALIICCVFFTLYALSLVYPILWVFVKSFSDPIEFKFDPERFFPSKIYFGNYQRMVKEFNFPPMIFNTIILSLITPTVQIAACCCISYAYARFNFRGKGIVFFIAISSMFIPSVGTLAATYELMNKLKLMDRLYGYVILCGNGMGFSFLLMSSQYQNVSKEYAEAAEIDGASKFRTFAQIITPQVLPTVICFWILSFIGCWNDYMMPYLFLPSHTTLSVGIRNLNITAQQSGGTDYPILFAGIVMVEIPVLIIFFIFQEKIMNFSLGGGIKG